MENFKTKRNIIPFNGEKYSVWKLRIRSLLCELDVIKVIDEDPIIRCSTWEKSNRIAKSVIVEYLADSYLSFAKGDATAKEILASLDSFYEPKSIATQLALRKKLLTLKLQGDIPLTKHFAMFDDLITELYAAGAKLEETDKVAHLLLTLPTNYDGVITAIETLTEDNLTLAFVKTRLLDHEVKLKNESDTGLKVLQVENINKKLDKDKNGSTNPGNHYNQKTHNNQKNNYNQKNKYRNKNNFKSKKSFMKCHHCGRKGHMKNECYYFKRMTQWNNTNRGREERTVQTATMTEVPNKIQDSGFTFMIADYQDDPSGKPEISFILDSGASDHIINREDLFSNFTDLNVPLKISVAKHGEFVSATKKGTLNVTSNMGITGVLENVLYCREVPYNILSVTRMQKAGLTIVFNQDGTQICKDGEVIIRGKPLNNLTVIEFIVSNRVCRSVSQICNVNKTDYEVWHQRLGHISKNKFIELKRYKMIQDINLIDEIVPNDNLCEACIEGKQTRMPFNLYKDKSHITRPLYIVHSDVCGPITPPTLDNKNYFILFVDQYTHYCVVYLLTYKSDVFYAFKDYVAKSEAKLNLKLVHLYSDNGGEYLSTEMKNYCSEKGITYHLTVPRTPQQNGVSERMVRTITEKARSMINGAKLDKLFWGEAVLTAVKLINITPSRAIHQSKTPFEIWHDKKPEFKYLKIFGSTVYVHNKTSKNKFDSKTWKGILVGYEPNGYKVWNTNCEKFITVRDVIVDETNFLQSRPVIRHKGICDKYSHDKTDNRDERSKSVSRESQNSDSIKSDKSKSDVYECPNKIHKFDNITVDPSSDIIVDNDVNNSNQTFEPRRSDRLKERPTVSYNENDVDEVDYLLCAQSIICEVPCSYDEIKSRHDKTQWENAIKEEINSLLTNNTWTLVPMPSNKNIVDCKWIFSVKHDEFGKPKRYKARLVARGFSQKYLSDYNETFAPVARIASFRFIISFANQFNLLIHHMDVKTAFLNGNLKEEIYMRVPEGVASSSNQVCKLNKALYGLKR